MTNEKKQQLDELCLKFRRDLIEVLHAKQTGHPGGSLSVCEILTNLYFNDANITPENKDDRSRDKIVLCKGHAAPMLYLNLAEKGFFPKEKIGTLRDIDSMLQGHPCSKETPGVEASTGPLGAGYPLALGIALSDMHDGIDAYTYAILGDGEINEGVVWETCMNASKFKAFGYNTIVCDGHDVASLSAAIATAKTVKGVPTIILAKTVKGKGVSFMEGKNAWHGAPVKDEHYEAAMKELGGAQ